MTETNPVPTPETYGNNPNPDAARNDESVVPAQNIGLLSGKDLIPEHDVPKHGHRFGPWIFDRKRLVVVHRHENGYEVDLERLTTPQSIVYGILRMASKTRYAYPSEDIGELVRAITALLPHYAGVEISDLDPSRNSNPRARRVTEWTWSRKSRKRS